MKKTRRVGYEKPRTSRVVCRLFCLAGAQARGACELDPGRDVDDALHDRRHGAIRPGVLGRDPGAGAARCYRTAVFARCGRKKRHRKRRAHGTSRHVPRDARQFQLRRLLQTRSNCVRVGIHHAGPQARQRSLVRDRASQRRRGAGDLGARDRLVARSHHALGRGQLLDDGADWSVRTVHRDLLRHRTGIRIGA